MKWFVVVECLETESEVRRFGPYGSKKADLIEAGCLERADLSKFMVYQEAQEE